MKGRVLLARAVGLPVFDILKGYMVREEYRQFKTLISGTVKSISRYQLIRLRELLIHAYESTIFYHDRMIRTGFDPYSISSADDLKKLPVLTRSDLQNDWKLMISDKHDHRKLDKGSSSGSTGVPVVFFQDNNAISSGLAANMVGWELSGWQFGYKGLHMWGNPATVNEEWRKWGSRAKAVLFSQYKYPAYQLTDKRQFDILADRLIKGNFDFIDGYTNTIYLLSVHLRDRDMKLPQKLKMVLTTAENLLDHQRRSIEENLGPVYDTYGCSEINAIAYECRLCREYHIMEPHVFVEFGEEAIENGVRDLIITDLDNFAFPLIRYKNDDLAVVSATPAGSCSVPLKHLSRIAGRQSDIIRLPGGGTLSVPSFFGSMLLKKINGIKQYQVVLERSNLLTLLMVVGSEFTGEDRAILNKAVDEYLNHRIEYRIKFVEAIMPSASGKHRLLIDNSHDI